MSTKTLQRRLSWAELVSQMTFTASESSSSRAAAAAQPATGRSASGSSGAACGESAASSRPKTCDAFGVFGTTCPKDWRFPSKLCKRGPENSKRTVW